MDIKNLKFNKDSWRKKTSQPPTEKSDQNNAIGQGWNGRI